MTGCWRERGLDVVGLRKAERVVLGLQCSIVEEHDLHGRVCGRGRAQQGLDAGLRGYSLLRGTDLGRLFSQSCGDFRADGRHPAVGGELRASANCEKTGSEEHRGPQWPLGEVRSHHSPPATLLLSSAQGFGSTGR